MWAGRLRPHAAASGRRRWNHPSSRLRGSTRGSAAGTQRRPTLRAKRHDNQRACDEQRARAKRSASSISGPGARIERPQRARADRTSGERASA